MADTALGKQAEVLAHGDLARNGLEQILVVNRNSSLPDDSAGGAQSIRWNPDYSGGDPAEEQRQVVGSVAR